ncbi:hypothetical protein HYZ05_01290 [Candidatus Daviesbacteria bacterium]|nr:hypothetical protein [Candidatus Daviesbacteria bacterium]
MRIPITEKELFQEIAESIDNLKSFLKDILKDQKLARIKPLSVELRKLLNPKIEGDGLLARAEQVFGIELHFPEKSKTLPRTEVIVTLDEYINRLAFSLGGRAVTRIQLVKVVADQKGAHVDPRPDVLHIQSKGVILPLGNPARNKLFFEQNYQYLISFTITVMSVVEEQIIKRFENSF